MFDTRRLLNTIALPEQAKCGFERLKKLIKKAAKCETVLFRFELWYRSVNK